jgi:hypothetical protein
MKLLIILPAVACLSMNTGQAQKTVLSYPFQFEKSFLAKGQYDCYFLNSLGDSSFALILKDNKKVEYICLNRDFKIINNISEPIGSTVLDQPAALYLGGTAKGGEYHFVYQVKSSFMMETVNFNEKTVRDNKLFELPESGKSMVSFSDNNTYFSIAADDKSGELVLHLVNSDGQLIQKNIPVPPSGEVKNNRFKVSGYLNNRKVITSSEYPDLDAAEDPAKLISQPGRLTFLTNAGHKAYIFSINLADFSTQDDNLDYGDLLGNGGQRQEYSNSYLLDNTLYSVLGDKKTFRITAHDLATNTLLVKYEFDEQSGSEQLAQPPVKEERYGRKLHSKEATMKNIIKDFLNSEGNLAILVARTESGQVLLTAGTYGHINYGGGSAMPRYMGGFDHSSTTNIPNIGAVPNFNPYMYRLPGNPTIGTTSARDYFTTHFSMLLDSGSLKAGKGRVPVAVGDQIKDYLGDTDKKSKATNQFAIGKKQYFGYYDRESQAYVIEQISIL